MVLVLCEVSFCGLGFCEMGFGEMGFGEVSHNHVLSTIILHFKTTLYRVEQDQYSYSTEDLHDCTISDPMHVPRFLLHFV